MGETGKHGPDPAQGGGEKNHTGLLEQAGKKQIPWKPDQSLGKMGRVSPLGRETSALQAGGTSLQASHKPLCAPGAFEKSSTQHTGAAAAGERAAADAPHPVAGRRPQLCQSQGVGLGALFWIPTHLLS